ncbi:MAG: ComF family protein [Candidatus Omnitrophica bacterium]|nr:ComF family protein [Candidatus Omnitrophota bacterium]
MLNRLLHNLSNLVFPGVCETCDTAMPPSLPPGVCPRCESEIKWISPPFCARCGRTTNGGAVCASCGKSVFHYDRAFACAWYEGKMKELLHLYKFGGRKHLRNFLIRKMTEFIRRHLPPSSFDAVAAVPLDAAKKRKRGFNQSELLSSQIAEAFRISHLTRALVRTKPSVPQARLDKIERQTNVKGCFRLSEPAAVKHKNLLLVDDILTTGQTTSECARVLKGANAASVTVLVCARGA